MIDKLACSIRSAMMETGYFNVFFPLAERVTNGKQTYYSQPNDGNVYVDIFNMDVNGTGYCRLSGKVNFDQIRGQKLTSCELEPTVIVTVPLRMVVAIPKKEGITEHELAFQLTSILNDITVIDGLVSETDIQVKSYDTDSLSIWPHEVEGDKYQVNFKYNYIAFDFVATVQSKLSCLIPVCDGYTNA